MAKTYSGIIDSPITIERFARVSSGTIFRSRVTFVGNSEIGEKCKFHEDVVIHGKCVVRGGCNFHASAEISGAVIFEDCTFDHLISDGCTFLGDAVSSSWLRLWRSSVFGSVISTDFSDILESRISGDLLLGSDAWVTRCIVSGKISTLDNAEILSTHAGGGAIVGDKATFKNCDVGPIFSGSATILEYCNIGGSSVIGDGSNVISCGIGDRVSVGESSHLYCIGDIGKDVTIGEGSRSCRCQGKIMEPLGVEHGMRESDFAKSARKELEKYGERTRRKSNITSRDTKFT